MMRRRTVSSYSASAYLYLLPAAVFLIGVTGYGLVFTANVSVYEWNGVNSDARWVGADNYVRMLHDPVIALAFLHILLVALTIPVTLLIGLLFATLLHSRVRGKSLVKVFLFLPVVISPALMAPTFRQIFGPEGLLNTFLAAVGLGFLTRPWLADPSTALAVIAVLIVWSSVGFAFFLYYAQLTAIDPQILEAARLDGAGNVRVFFSFLAPLSRPTTATLVLLSTISLMKLFDLPYLITGGGPAHATEFLGTYLFQQSVQFFDAGYAAAISVVMVVTCIVLSVLQATVGRRVRA